MQTVAPVPFTKSFDAGPGSGGRIGLLVLGRDPVCEVECSALVSGGDVTLHVARIADPVDFRAETLAMLAEPICAAADSILADDRLDVVAVACASAVLAIGAEALAQKLKRARPSLEVTDPGTAAVAVLNAAGVRRLSLLLTTADPEVNERTISRYEAAGFEIARARTLCLADDKSMSTLSLHTISEALTAVAHPRSEAILAPCTAMRTWLTVAQSANAYNHPVLTGNRAMIMHARSLAAGIALPDFLRC